ncbi:MAG: hypothetical protein GY810_14960 [Aureispira sp.]|nr:hypothetical protein [Aureispira sp.]
MKRGFIVWLIFAIILYLTAPQIKAQTYMPSLKWYVASIELNGKTLDPKIYAKDAWIQFKPKAHQKVDSTQPILGRVEGFDGNSIYYGDYKSYKGKITYSNIQKIKHGDAVKGIEVLEAMFEDCNFKAFPPQKRPPIWNPKLFLTVRTRRGKAIIKLLNTKNRPQLPVTIKPTTELASKPVVLQRNLHNIPGAITSVVDKHPSIELYEINRSHIPFGDSATALMVLPKDSCYLKKAVMSFKWDSLIMNFPPPVGVSPRLVTDLPTSMGRAAYFFKGLPSNIPIKGSFIQTVLNQPSNRIVIDQNEFYIYKLLPYAQLPAIEGVGVTEFRLGNERLLLSEKKLGIAASFLAKNVGQLPMVNWGGDMNADGLLDLILTIHDKPTKYQHSFPIQTHSVLLLSDQDQNKYYTIGNFGELIPASGISNLAQQIQQQTSSELIRYIVANRFYGLIDSNGQLFNPISLETFPPDVLDKVHKVLANLKFEPARTDGKAISYAYKFREPSIIKPRVLSSPIQIDQYFEVKDKSEQALKNRLGQAIYTQCRDTITLSQRPQWVGAIHYDGPTKTIWHYSLFQIPYSDGSTPQAYPVQLKFGVKNDLRSNLNELLPDVAQGGKNYVLKPKEEILNIAKKEGRGIVKGGQSWNYERFEYSKEHGCFVWRYTYTKINKRYQGKRIKLLINATTGEVLYKDIEYDVSMRKCLPKGTLISTPFGRLPVEQLQPNTLVYTLNEQKEKVAAPLQKVESLPVGKKHRLIRVTLEDSTVLVVSEGHPLDDYWGVEYLANRIVYNGKKIEKVERLLMQIEQTWDLLPSSTTGVYWANGVCLGSTMKQGNIVPSLFSKKVPATIFFPSESTGVSNGDLELKGNKYHYKNKPFTGTVRHIGEKGKGDEIDYKKGKQLGWKRKFGAYGTLEEAAWTKNGHKTGPVFLFYANGALKKKGNYRRSWVTIYKSNIFNREIPDHKRKTKKNRITRIKQSQPAGKWETYLANGKLSSSRKLKFRHFSYK